jgi:hypothetical protein
MPPILQQRAGNKPLTGLPATRADRAERADLRAAVSHADRQ